MPISSASHRPAPRGWTFGSRAAWWGFASLPIVAVALLEGAGGTQAQGIDCGRLQAQIARLDRRGGGGTRSAGMLRRQGAEIARTQAYAHQLGCDNGFSFFGGNPQCGGLNQRLQQLQAGLAQLQQGGSEGGGSAVRSDLVARYDAYCRQQPQQPRGFFESIFGAPQPEQARPAPLPDMPPRDARGDREGDPDLDGGEVHAHGGSQAVCVRTCDGGFFPLGLSLRRGDENLTEMCQALCPGTEATVYTRNPDAEIKTAVSLDGKPYSDLPNALKFEKTATPACSCHPAGKTWAEALQGAEEFRGHAGKGDIVITQEKSDALSRPNLDPAARAALLRAKPATAMANPDAADTPPAPDVTASSPEDDDLQPGGITRPPRRAEPQP